MSHATDALAALDELYKIDPRAGDAFIETHRLTAFATTYAMLAQADATNHHTEVIVSFMAATLTNAQAKVLLEALTGLGNKMKP